MYCGVPGANRLSCSQERRVESNKLLFLTVLHSIASYKPTDERVSHESGRMALDRQLKEKRTAPWKYWYLKARGSTYQRGNTRQKRRTGVESCNVTNVEKSRFETKFPSTKPIRMKRRPSQVEESLWSSPIGP